MTGITLKIAWIKAHRERFGSSWVTAKNRVEAGWRPGDPDAGGELASIPMILFCPECGLQHIDAAPSFVPDPGGDPLPWTNPPHRSHLCAECGHIWRPADVPTTGVAEITTAGKDDTFPITRGRASAVRK